MLSAFHFNVRKTKSVRIQSNRPPNEKFDSEICLLDIFKSKMNGFNFDAVALSIEHFVLQFVMRSNFLFEIRGSFRTGKLYRFIYSYLGSFAMNAIFGCLT